MHGKAMEFVEGEASTLFDSSSCSKSSLSISRTDAKLPCPPIPGKTAGLPPIIDEGNNAAPAPVSAGEIRVAVLLWLPCFWVSEYEGC